MTLFGWYHLFVNHHQPWHPASIQLSSQNWPIRFWGVVLFKHNSPWIFHKLRMWLSWLLPQRRCFEPDLNSCFLNLRSRHMQIALIAKVLFSIPCLPSLEQEFQFSFLQRFLLGYIYVHMKVIRLGFSRDFSSKDLSQLTLTYFSLFENKKVQLHLPYFLYIKTY